MITRLALDPEALSTDEGAACRQQRALLLNHIDRHGELAETDDMYSLLKLAKRLLPNLERARWYEVLKRTQHIERGRSVLEATRTEELFFLNYGQVLFLEASRFSRLFPDSKEEPVLISGSSTEAVTPACLSESRLIGQLRELSKTGLWKGDSREQIWEERFSPFARISKRIRVVDAYLLQHPDVLRWFLEHLQDVGGLNSTRIISTLGDPTLRDGDKDVATRLDDLIAQIGIRTWWSSGELELVAARRTPHDRWLRFDDHRLVLLGRGLDCLDKDRLSRDSSFTYQVLRNRDERARYRDLEEEAYAGRLAAQVVNHFS